MVELYHTRGEASLGIHYRKLTVNERLRRASATKVLAAEPTGNAF